MSAAIQAFTLLNEILKVYICIYHVFFTQNIALISAVLLIELLQNVGNLLYYMKLIEQQNTYSSTSETISNNIS